jgi:hypothetical protein
LKYVENGRTVDDDEWSGRPSTSRSKPLTTQVKDAINGNHGLAVPEVAEDVGIFIGSCHTILMEDLRMHWVSEKCLLRLLTDE